MLVRVDQARHDQTIRQLDLLRTWPARAQERGFGHLHHAPVLDRNAQSRARRSSARTREELPGKKDDGPAHRRVTAKVPRRASLLSHKS